MADEIDMVRMVRRESRWDRWRRRLNEYGIKVIQLADDGGQR
jgi:hypothetical protein